MSKARVIGACSAGSTIYNCNVNLNTAGGNKKQGLPFQLDRRTFQHRAVKIKATGNRRDYIFTMNQIGGIGRVEWYPRDGIRPREPYQYGLQNKQTTISNETNTVLSCDADSNANTPNTFSYNVNDIYYILLPTVPCNPFTITSLQFNILNENSLLRIPATYIPNGPTNGNTGYVFEINQLSEFYESIYTTNFNCSTENINTLVIKNNGNTPIIIDSYSDSYSIIVIQGQVCNNAKTILYNGINYDVLVCYVSESITYFVISGNLEQAEFNGSVECI